MTRTRRIYHSWKRYGKFMSQWAADFDSFSIKCMGNCHWCKDRKKDQKHRTAKDTTAKLEIMAL